MDAISIIGVQEAVSGLLREHGYDVQPNASLIILAGDNKFHQLAELKSATPAPRVILIANDFEEKLRALDQGADDAIEANFHPDELLARVRGQLRAHHSELALQAQVRIAEEGFEVAQTAFRALAVTERMTSDAFSLQKLLKVTAYAIIASAAIAAVVLAIFTGGERRENQKAYHTIADLEKRLLTTKSSPITFPADPVAEHKQKLANESEALREQIADAKPSEVAALRQQLDATNQHLVRIDGEGRMARSIIGSYSSSVCMLHVVVAFRDHVTGRRLRYEVPEQPAGDVKPEPKFTLAGSGPEVHIDFFGTGFLASADGRIITNHHVAEPWWENEELAEAEKDNLEPIAIEMTAYFPNDPKTYLVKTEKISAKVDLAMMKVRSLVGDPDLSTLQKRAIPLLDGAATGAERGEAVVLMGYPTGIDAILARTSDATAATLLKNNSHDLMSELAKRRLIRPIVTQGHIGDILRDKIVYDAQTTSGGSGGPLFNSQGKVIGVNFAILQGFGGSNFGIPIRYAAELLK